MVDLEKSPLKVGQADDEYLDPLREGPSKAKEEEEEDEEETEEDGDEDEEETEEDEDEEETEEDEDEEETEEEEDEGEEEEEEAAAAEEGKPMPGWFSQLVAAATYAKLIIIKLARRTKALFG